MISNHCFADAPKERIAVDPGKGVGWNTLCDICGLLPIVLKGRRTPLTEDDIPQHTPPTFSLVSDDGSAVANQIDSLADALRSSKDAMATRTMKKQKGGSQGGSSSPWPLVLRMVYSERKALVVVGVVFGILHGVINSMGRFILLRAAINAVVNESPFEERLGLAIGVVLVIAFEGVLLLCVKHFFADHIAHYAGGRMSTVRRREC